MTSRTCRVCALQVRYWEAMKGPCTHTKLFFPVATLVAAVMLCATQSYGQTQPGTRILNEAKGVFRYKTGVKDSLRSNRTETVVQPSHSAATSIAISLVPDAIVGNGIDSAQVTVTVRDASGNPVPDGALVTFVTGSGTFRGGKDTITVPTVNGFATAPVVSAVVSQQIVTARVTATTIGINSIELSTSATVLFFPGAITGSVFSAYSGKPVSGALVVAADGSQAEAGRDTTGIDGKYLVPLSKGGAYTHTITLRNRFGDQVQAVFREQLAIPAQGGIPPTGSLNTITGNLVDRATGNPIRQAGIRVSLNLNGALPRYQMTDARGVFTFDSLNPGSYEIRSDDPHYAGTVFVHDTLLSSFLVDVALGVSSEVLAFEVVKSANKRIAEIGDAVAYMLDIRNTSATASLASIKIVDELPLGFMYVSGSSRLEHVATGDPSGSQHLEWVLPDTLAPGKSTRLSYMTTLGSGSMDGDGVNHAYGLAQSLGGDTVRSLVASISVVVRPGIFTDHGIVIGKVFFEENENGVQDYGENGIAGVELWMEDGTHIITGDDGKYSLPDVKPGQHVIRIDQRTLPAGSTVLAIESESAGKGTTRFVRLVDGGIARADFHVRPPHQASLAASVSPSPATGQIQASFVIKCRTKPLPSMIALADTLPRGLSYDMQSLTLNGSPVAGLTGQTRMLYLELPIGQADSLDSVRVNIVRDTSFVKRVGVMRPKLVVSYPRRRDAVFGTVETFAIPGPAEFGSLTERKGKRDLK
jgi:uncharacterized repeat protein (TIGR01451 family)